MAYLFDQTYLFDLTHAMHEFLDQGGFPLWAILLVSLLIFSLFFERWLFLTRSFPQQLRHWQYDWQNRQDQQSWPVQRIRDALLAQGNASLNQHKWLLKVAIAVCPLLGLIGTVSGMILVFDELAFFGNANPRIMSAGIFKATLPTMAGMLVAIIGLLLQTLLKRLSQEQHEALLQSLSPLLPDQASRQTIKETAPPNKLGDSA